MCAAKNSASQRLRVVSQMVALAPFSQNSNSRGCFGFAQEHDTHMTPSGLFCRRSWFQTVEASSPSSLAFLTTDLREPQPPVGLS